MIKRAPFLLALFTVALVPVLSYADSPCGYSGQLYKCPTLQGTISDNDQPINPDSLWSIQPNALAPQQIMVDSAEYTGTKVLNQNAFATPICEANVSDANTKQTYSLIVYLTQPVDGSCQKQGENAFCCYPSQA